MTTPAAPGAPEGTQGTTAPGAPASPASPAQPNTDPQPATQQPKPPAPGAQGIGKPDQGQQSAPESKPDDGKPETQDVSALPDWAQKLLKDARADAAKARTGAKQTAADDAVKKVMGDIAKALGMSPDGDLTPDQLNEQYQQQIEERDARIEELQAKQTEADYQDYIRDAAGPLGLDPKMLYGWQDFRDAVHGELPDDLDDDTFDAALKAAVGKIAKTYVGNPRFAANGTAPPRSGTPMPGAPQQQQPKKARSLKEAVAWEYGHRL